MKAKLVETEVAHTGELELTPCPYGFNKALYCARCHSLNDRIYWLSCEGNGTRNEVIHVRGE